MVEVLVAPQPCRKPWEDFRIVAGYLPEVGAIPSVAAKLHLPFRSAAVLHYGDVPQSPLYWELVQAIVEYVPAESVVFDFDYDETPLRFMSLAQMQQHMAGRPEVDVAFNRATLFKSGKPTALIDVEPYALGGGPFPFSDSWTFAVYRAAPNVAALREACYAVCQRHGLPILEELQGRETPQPRAWWRRCLDWALR